MTIQAINKELSTYACSCVFIQLFSQGGYPVHIQAIFGYSLCSYVPSIFAYSSLACFVPSFFHMFFRICSFFLFSLSLHFSVPIRKNIFYTVKYILLVLSSPSSIVPFLVCSLSLHPNLFLLLFTFLFFAITVRLLFIIIIFIFFVYLSPFPLKISFHNVYLLSPWF